MRKTRGVKAALTALLITALFALMAVPCKSIASGPLNPKWLQMDIDLARQIKSFLKPDHKHIKAYNSSHEKSGDYQSRHMGYDNSRHIY